MKLYILTFLFAAVVIAECRNTFMGTNVMRPLVYRQNIQFNPYAFRKRVENFNFVLPNVPFNYGRSIQGILAYDMTHSGATVDVTQGGIGFRNVNLRIESDRGQNINYDLYIFA